jgi:uncharacterized protein (TIGR02996 family)
MTDTEEMMLQAIEANRQDDASRLIYADWLEENGQVEKAEFLRLKVEARHTHKFSDRFIHLTRQMDIEWCRRTSYYVSPKYLPKLR